MRHAQRGVDLSQVLAIASRQPLRGRGVFSQVLKRPREHLLEWTGLEFDPQVVRALLALEPIKELTGYARPFESAVSTARADF